MVAYEWHCVKSIDFDEWPLADDGDDQEAATKLAPPKHVWMRCEEARCYRLMRFEGEVDAEEHRLANAEPAQQPGGGDE